jgi:uncharacterized protein (TIGR01777 family)
MNILITGATGGVGSRLIPVLKGRGHEVCILTSSSNKQNVQQKVFFWNPDKEIFPSDFQFKPDSVIHLAGANIAAKRWSTAYRNEIVRSRVNTSLFLHKQLLKFQALPQHYVTASGTDIYPDGMPEACTETTAAGSNFLATVCIQWEAAADIWAESGSAVSILRTPVVLMQNQGFLKTMLATTGLGIIPVTGGKKNRISWIHISDLCKAYALAAEGKLTGIFNAVAPNNTSMGALVNAIDKARGTTTLHPVVPAFLLKLILGEMGSLACSNRAVSAQKLLNTEFKFEFPDIQTALNNVIP